MNVDYYPDPYFGYDEVIQKTENVESFHVGQCYENTVAQPIECKKCHGVVFNVAQGHCYTAIRCPVCKWEFCIHEG